MGILGTYTGIPVQGALANSRIVGVFVEGCLAAALYPYFVKSKQYSR